MADRTNLLWTDATLNVVTGCEKISPGCKHCYAERDWRRLSAQEGTVYFGRKFTDIQCHPERVDQPLRWTRPRKIFVNAMSDLFHEDVPEAFIDQVFAMMAVSHVLGRGHVFQVLTKRAERMNAYLNDPDTQSRVKNAMAAFAAPYKLKTAELVWPLPNVWLGVTVENQAAALERIPLLQAAPAAIRWLSAEPLVGAVDIAEALLPGLPVPDWVVGGGESGDNARPMNIRWARGLRDQCKALGIAFLFKQWGTWTPARLVDGNWVPEDAALMVAVGDKVHDFGDGYGAVHAGRFDTGRILDGVLHEDYPANFAEA